MTPVFACLPPTAFLLTLFVADFLPVLPSLVSIWVEFFVSCGQEM
jgi:hypothetical protein